MRLSELRALIGVVPQDCVLFNDTILYNIAYGGLNDPEVAKMIDDPDKIEELLEVVVPAAKQSQVHPLVMDLKLGYFAKVGERGLKLSGGEKQRVAIARALLKKTPILCFDEATSALDTGTEQHVQEAINLVSKGSTSLIIAHRLSTVQHCDKIIVLKHGEIVETGSHLELLNLPNGYYQNLWNRQSEQIEITKMEQETKEKEKLEFEKVIEERKRDH